MRRGLQKVSFFFGMAADYGVSIYCLLILAVLPFYFTEGYAHIGTDKAQFFRAVNEHLGAVLVFLAVLVLLSGLPLRRPKVFERNGLTVVDGFVMLYGISLAISYFFSDYRETAWLGSTGWYMGFFTQAAFVLAYFMISRLWKPRKWMLYLILPVSAAVFLLGYLDRLGIHLIEMDPRSEAYISTIGNINWYCGYAVTVFFGGVILYWQGEKIAKWLRALLAAYILLGFGTLLTQGSESGIVTMGVILLVLFALSAQNMKKMQRFLQILLLFSAACVVSYLLTALRGDEAASTDGELLKAVNSGWFAALMTLVSIASLTWMYRCKRADRYCKKAVIRTSRIINGVCAALVLLVLLLAAVNTIRPGSLGKLSSLALFTFTETWGNGRVATWKAALCCFWEQNFLHKLVGVGPDAMSAYMYTAGSAGLREMLERCFGTATLTNAHNEWLTVLADTGLLGLLSFAGIVISAIRLFVKRGEEEPVLMACGFCLLAYTVNNIFSFQQTVNGATMYVLLGMGMAFVRKPKDNCEPLEDEITVS